MKRVFGLSKNILTGPAVYLPQMQMRRQCLATRATLKEKFTEGGPTSSEFTAPTNKHTKETLCFRSNV